MFLPRLPLLPLTAKYISTMDHWQLKMDQFNCKLDFYKDLLAIKYMKIKKTVSEVNFLNFLIPTKMERFFYFFRRKCIDVVLVFGPFHLNLCCLSRVSVKTYHEISIQGGRWLSQSPLLMPPSVWQPSPPATASCISQGPLLLLQHPQLLVPRWSDWREL